VDTLIKTLSDSIHTTKRYLKFGIAPFGIWQNRSQSIEGSATNGGSSYVELYADTRKWLQLGWIDYVVPQLYWPLKHRLADFEILIDWWSNNTYGKHLYIGQAAYRAGENVQGFKNRSEIPNQIRHLRQNARVQGSVYFSSKSLTSNIAGLQDSLRNSFYCYPVLQPPMLWLDSIPPMAPRELTTLISTNSRVQLNWKEPLSARDGEATYGYVIYRFISGEQQNLQDGSKILKIIFDNKTFSYIDYSVQRGAKYTYVVTALDRLKNESIPSNQIAVIVN
jgi:hypothetical protein